MADLILFTDGSVNPESNIGYGAYLAVPEGTQASDVQKSCVKVKRFERTSSTKLELQTLLWALSDVPAQGVKVMVYTDSQNIMGLPGRREKFEHNDYRSKKNRHIRNFKLYQEFYEIMDQLDCEFVKVRGHTSRNQKNAVEKLFTFVDRASRSALRNE